MASEETGIRRLPDEVVNRIAAGEVVTSPAAALKEILENSIDASATSVDVSVLKGGMKMLQIADNGCGIKPEDMRLACERFATSKLRKFEDLTKVCTFGFRGEALASISQVARVTIITMRKDSVCAYKASYQNGKISGDPEPCAGVPGTTVIVEDLFYNMPTRRRVLKGAAEEYRALAEVVSRYSVHYAAVAFSCRKLGDNSGADVRTVQNATTLDNIRLAFGKGLADELLEFSLALEVPNVSGSGYVSNANYSLKRRIFILFINGRLVEHMPLRRAVENVHAEFSPKGTYPFFYLQLNMNPENVDVNIHPTKQEVRFLHGQTVVETVSAAISERLKSNQTSRVYHTQTLVRTREPETAPVPPSALVGDALNATAFGSGANDPPRERTRPSPTTMPTIAPQKKVRTTAFSQGGAMEKFVSSTGTKELTPSTTTSGTQHRRSVDAPPLLTSVRNLQKRCRDRSNSDLSEAFRECSYVGVVDPHHLLVQNGRRLLIVQLVELAREILYQRILQKFADLPQARLSSNVPVVMVVEERLGQPDSGWTEAEGDRHTVAEAIAELLMSRAEMLSEYFGVGISKQEDGTVALTGLPVPLDGYPPAPGAVPELLLRLGTLVTWDEEEQCFHDIAEQIASCYALPHPWDAADKDLVAACEYKVKHVVLPASKSSFYPPRRFLDEDIVQEVATLERLYRTFERC